ncbi:MAG: MipA/OmpV family protein [Hyphomicrobiaceae bacterium]
MIRHPFRSTASTLAIVLAMGATAANAGGDDYGAPADPGFSVQVGGMAIVKPKYEGSKDYEVTGVPLIAPSGMGSGLVQFKGLDDLRFRILNSGGFEAGPVAGYRFGRDEGDSARLLGLGDVDGGLVVGGFVAYRMGPISPFVTYNHQVTGDDTGGLARAGIEVKHEFGQRVTATFTGGTTWADDDYMSAYFGVTALQSANSGLARFDAESGFKDVFIGVSADVPLGEQWTLKLMGRYAHLLGDAADSPVVETESQWTGGLGLTYRFTIPR